MGTGGGSLSITPLLTIEMGKKTPEAEDTWFGVHDAKKRKQIQDRLAQRARRKIRPDIPLLSLLMHV